MSQDIDYYRKRAEAEALRALETPNALEAAVHNEMSAMYTAKAEALETE